MSAMVPPVVAKEVSAVAPPTMPEYVTVPVPAATVRAYAPSTVEPKLTLLLVVLSVSAAPKVTAPLYVCAPVVVTLPFKAIVPAVVDKEASAVVPPTMPEYVTVPVPAATVRAFAPLTVVLKLTLAFEVFNVLAPVSVTAPV